jgi:hypothetical protein
MAVSMHRLPDGQRVNDIKPGLRPKDTITISDTSIRFTSILFKNSDADPANNDISAMDDKGTKYHLIVAGGKITSMEINDKKVADNMLPGYTYILHQINNELAEKRRLHDIDVARLQQWKASHDSAWKKISADEDSLKAMARGKQPVKPRAGGYVSVTEPAAMASKFAAMQARMRDDSANYRFQLERVLSVIADLVREKVVPDAASVKWFGLSDSEFIVNGQKQPGPVQQRYKTKYQVRKNYGLYYGPVQMHGTGVFIDAPVVMERTKGPHPKYIGTAGPSALDSANWKLQELMMKQRLFAAEQNSKREQLKLQQQLFAAEQEGKRQQLLLQKKLILAEHDSKLQQKQEAQLLKWKTMADQSGLSKVALPEIIANVTDDLVSANVLKDKNELVKFNLTNAALLVNGKKQSEDLHEKLKEKYLQQPNYSSKAGFTTDPNFGVHFNAQSGSMGLGITSGPDSP